MHPALLLAAGLAVVALALRLHNIDREPLWLDEGYTLLFSRLPFPRLFLVGGAHEHPPLYYLTVHLLIAVHDSYLIPRYISAVAGAVSVLLLYLIGARLYGRLAGLTAAALLTVAPFHVWYGQDGRGYEFAGMFVLLSYAAGLLALERRRPVFWGLYALALAACLYSEYTTIFVLLPQALFVIPARKGDGERPAQLKGLILAWGGAAILFAPWLGILAFDAAEIAAEYWIPAPNAPEVANTFLQFLGLITSCPATPCTGHEVGVPGLAGREVLIAAIAGLAALAVLLVAVWQRRIRLLIPSLWLVLPFAVVLAIAIMRSLYLDRVFLDATFGLYLLLAAGIAATRRPLIVVLSAILSLAIVTASIASLGSIYAGGTNPDWKSAARDFSRAYRPGQSVLFNPGVLRSLLDAYLPGGWHATSETTLWSRSYIDVPGWQNRYPQPLNPSRAERSRIEATLRNIQVAAAARGHRQVWLITLDYPGMNDTRRWFTEHGFQNLISELYAGDTRIELWDRRGPSDLGPAVVSLSGFGQPWAGRGDIRERDGVARTEGATELTRRFAVTPEDAYSVSVDYRGIPLASKPRIAARIYDSAGHLLATFPRTQWYDWPVNGVWLSQPFGFIAPPGSARAVLTLSTSWGESYWRRVAVYRERRVSRVLD